MHVAFKYNHIPSPRRLQMPVLHLHCAGLPSLRRSYVQAVAANRDTPLPKLLQLQLLSEAKAPCTLLWSARFLDQTAESPRQGTPKASRHVLRRVTSAPSSTPPYPGVWPQSSEATSQQPVLLAVTGQGLHTFSAGSVRGCTGGGPGPGRNPAGFAPWGACVRGGAPGAALGSTRNSSAVSPSRSSRSCSAYQFKPCRSAGSHVSKFD